MFHFWPYLKDLEGLCGIICGYVWLLLAFGANPRLLIFGSDLDLPTYSCTQLTPRRPQTAFGIYDFKAAAKGGYTVKPKQQAIAKNSNGERSVCVRLFGCENSRTPAETKI